MDNTREKLVELIGSTEYGNGSLVGNNFQKGFIEKIASNLIAHGVTVQEWISVKDRLPFAEYGESDDVLAITELGVMRTLYFDGGNWCFQNGECCPHKVTHWTFLPQPPKGE